MTVPSVTDMKPGAQSQSSSTHKNLNSASCDRSFWVDDVSKLIRPDTEKVPVDNGAALHLF